MNPIYALLLAITSSMASDLCHFIDTEFIGLYQKFDQNGTEVVDRYLLFRPDSTEMWEISAELDERNEVKFVIGDKSDEVNDLNATKIFDVIVTEGVIWKCWVEKELFKSRTYCSTQTKTIRSNVIIGSKLVFHPIPDNRSLVVARGQTSDNTFERFLFSLDGITIMKGQNCDKSHCPKFLYDMNRDIYDRIEGIVGFNTSGVSGHLTLFNIKGWHKYCFQTYGNENQSSTCIRPSNMRSLAPQCETREFPWFLISVICIPAVIIVIAVIGILYFFLRKKKQRLSITSYDSREHRSGPFIFSDTSHTSDAGPSQIDDKPKESKVVSKTSDTQNGSSIDSVFNASKKSQKVQRK